MNVSEVPVAILAGGRATRLKGLTRRLPKALLDVCGRPFLEHQLAWLRTQRVRKVVVCVGYRGDRITRAIGDGGRFALELRVSRDGPNLLGTAGAIKRALPQLGDLFFTLYGDTYLDCELEPVLRRFLASGATALMTVLRNDNRWGPSNVEFASGRIIMYDKKAPSPRMRHIDYGLGLFRREVFDGVPERRFHDLEQVYQEVLRQGRLAAFEVSRRFHEIGSPEGLAETRKHLKGARP